jgi:hypothetical protein
LFVAGFFGGRGGFVEVDAGFEEEADDFGAAGAGGEEERGEDGLDG